MGLCLLYILADIPINIDSIVPCVVIRFFEMGTVLTALEFVVGFVTLKVTKVRLWDYSKVWGNIMGLICPKFYLAWGALGTAYVFFLHGPIKSATSGAASILLRMRFTVNSPSLLRRSSWGTTPPRPSRNRWCRRSTACR